jgi:signal peptidase I
MPSATDPVDLDDELEPEDSAPRRRPTSSKHRGRSPKPRRPVRKWEGSPSDEDEPSDDELEPRPPRRSFLDRESRPVYWRARDSLWFEPLIAVAIIVVLLVGLWAYTQNWPPVYVVESQSMQHGSNDVLGVINTGDLVLAQRIPTGDITPYVTGLQTGYSTYGEYGDVVLYSADGGGTTPVIHRAILFLAWDSATLAYNATDLAGLPCGSGAGAVYMTTGTPGDCGTTDLRGTLELFHIGWQSIDVVLNLSSPLLGEHSGFVTMGDNNLLPIGCTTNCVGGLPDQVDGLSTLVEPGWILGVARGMIPWFGALKLLLEGNAGNVPPQSWQYLGLTIVGLIALAFAVHYALRREGIEDERRKAEDAEAAAEAAARGPSRTRRFLRALRPWKHSTDDDEEAAPPPPKKSTRPVPPASGRHRGRPAPKVRRAPKKKTSDDPEDDGEL